VKIRCNDFRVKPGTAVDLNAWPTLVEPFYRSKQDYQSQLEAHTEALAQLQSLLYASNSHALLVILQGMDASGKDGAIKHVMSGLNPQGCSVTSFSHPSPSELEHDFLWRTTRCLPARRYIGIFNRSYYEEVLIVRVRPEILAAEHLPQTSSSAAKSDAFWQRRYRSIVDLERHLHFNGTRIVKLFLHISREEQRTRLLERIDDPRKNWKFSSADLEARQSWGRYMRAYAQCLSATTNANAPWYVVPADDKRNARLIISSIVQDALRGLRMRYPQADAAQRAELRKFRRLLTR
jgi:PPK2 family polyphosphate:nucleotide phosphotransferase